MNEQPSTPASGARGAVKASWIMLIVTCGLSMVPALGFATWLIAVPVLFITLILGIIAMSKGATTQGVLILLATIIGAPVFIGLAPIVSTAIVGAAAESATQASEEVSYESNAAPADKSSTATTPPAAPTQATVGDVVTFGDSKWTVVQVNDRGSRLPGNMFVEDKTTEGRFIKIAYKVENLGNEEEMIMFTPRVRDSRGRTFEDMDSQEMYLGEGQTSITLEQLPAGLPKTFYGIYEVPADATGLVFLCRSLDSGRHEKPVNLGL